MIGAHNIMVNFYVWIYLCLNKEILKTIPQKLVTLISHHISFLYSPYIWLNFYVHISFIKKISRCPNLSNVPFLIDKPSGWWHKEHSVWLYGHLQRHQRHTNQCSQLNHHTLKKKKKKQIHAFITTKDWLNLQVEPVWTHSEHNLKPSSIVLFFFSFYVRTCHELENMVFTPCHQ